MKTGYVLFNRKAGKRGDLDSLDLVERLFSDKLELIDVESIESYEDFVSGLGEEDYIVICGGDGTINKFINNMKQFRIENEIFYYPSGTGNDFAHELGHDKFSEPFPIKDYLLNLPTVTIDGNSYKFINGVGYGIDGYCCEVGDKLKATSDKPVNYTAIAIKGLLFHYKPTGARVTVDGITHEYKKVWLAPTMHGRCYGGGMIPTPEQERGSGLLSTMVFYGSGKLRTLMIFPNLFKGEHIKYKKNIAIHTGKEITVEFDRPTALQIDGETILGVTSYTARAAARTLSSAV